MDRGEEQGDRSFSDEQGERSLSDEQGEETSLSDEQGEEASPTNKERKHWWAGYMPPAAATSSAAAAGAGFLAFLASFSAACFSSTCRRALVRVPAAASAACSTDESVACVPTVLLYVCQRSVVWRMCADRNVVCATGSVVCIACVQPMGLLYVRGRGTPTAQGRQRPTAAFAGRRRFIPAGRARTFSRQAEMRAWYSSVQYSFMSSVIGNFTCDEQPPPPQDTHTQYVNKQGMNE
jgi:hypothetical protein